MRNFFIATFTYSFLILMVGGCDFNRSARANNPYSAKAKPKVDTNADSKPRSDIRIDKLNGFDGEDTAHRNEIMGCSPEKIFQGDTLKIKFKKNHGRNFAIFNEETRDFYFLTANHISYFPYMPSDKFAKQLTLELDVSKVRNASEETNSDGFYKSKSFFTKTGWYRVIIGHEALDVDFEDMPITGMCRIYYTNTKRPD